MIKISFEEKLISIGRRNFDENIHSSMPNGIITGDDRHLYSWNCVSNKNESIIPRELASFPVRISQSNFPFTFE